MYLLTLLLYFMLPLSNETPLQIHVLFRHGERSPTSTYPNDPHKDYQWPGGYGQLTNRGKLQMYNLGKNLKEHYKNFLTRYYWPIEVNFTSSYADRCLTSAELVAASLFPPNDFQIWTPELLWQPIPIHYLPRNMDNLIAMKTNCTKYDNEFKEVQNSSKMKQYNKDYKVLYEYLSEKTGMAVNNIETVESLFNTLEIQQLNNLTLPKWINSTLMSQMKVLAAQNLAIYCETEYMKKMKGGFFLRTVLDLMNKFSNGSSASKINMYSGHDLTIVHVLRTLNLTDVLKPDFGASVIIELHENSQIKLFYLENWSGTLQEKNFEKCTSPCTIEKFKDAFKTVLPVNWSEECQINI